ncbi:MAG: hypothetical protein JO307_15235 [Bryobacterales bacterium]|nr:hypothetical protein [Bryobacterales bacterium]MBV9399927.1 hypothetical protein [Bryobacterales bacterium]
MSQTFSFKDHFGLVGRTPSSAPDPRVRPVPSEQPGFVSEKRLELQIVFTSEAAVKSALAAASRFARDLDARFTIVAAQVVPYPLPLEGNPAQSRLLGQTLGAIAAAQPVETAVQVYVCRDPWDALRSVLQRESTVVIGGLKRWWWPTREQRLASLLRRDGHRVMFLNVKAA